MQKHLFLGVAGLLILVAGLGIFYYSNDKVMDSRLRGNDKQNMQAIIKTSLGEIKVELYDGDAPKTVDNFVKLAKEGFYDGVIFHRVIPKFMIQGGDPNCNKSGLDKGACGAGGPGYKFEDELNSATESYKSGYQKGVLAMANAGKNTNGSQFFIMVDNVPLPHSYTIFGKVISGQEVADKISLVKTSEGDRPVGAVVIENVSVLDISN